MLRPLPSLRLLAAVLFMALLPVFLPAGNIAAQTIENTADASWTFEGDGFATRSNTVSFAVAPPPTQIRTFEPVQSGGEGIRFNSPRCLGSRSPASTGASAGITPMIATIRESSRIRAGHEIIFEVRAPLANRDASQIDSLIARIEGAGGDHEEIEIFETDVDTSAFVGRIDTRRFAPGEAPGDCVLAVNDGLKVRIAAQLPDGSDTVAAAEVEILADPFGIVFDSETGAPVSGAHITLVDAVTGLPARVFAEDGKTGWPSSVVSGQPITDAAGNTHDMLAGEYWFPLTFLASYRIEVEPPAPYTAPSSASPADLAALTRPGGGKFVIADASFGAALALTSPEPVQVDIPLDRPGVELGLSKRASRQRVQPGDAVFYTVIATNPDPDRVRRNVTVVDTPSRWLRLRPESIRIDGAEATDAATIAPDGSSLRVAFGDLPPGASRRVTYAMGVRADAPPGQAINRAEATDSLGRTSFARAAVEIESDNIASRMTIVGRITAGGCDARTDRLGIPGVRVMMEDGSFAVTDRDGRYHFEGVVPGTHVVQAAAATLPGDGRFVGCTRSTRSAGSASSHFVIGQGGSLTRADFHAVVDQDGLAKLQRAADWSVAETGSADRESGRQYAAGGSVPERSSENVAKETDWLALGDGPDGWLAPLADHNPRAPAVKVAIRHRKGQTINLFADGRPVDALTFEGTRSAPKGRHAVSLWRGVPLNDGKTELTAEIVNSFGVVNATIARTVHFVSTPARAQIVPEQSALIADGRTRPVLAVRILDRNGRPVRGGVAGEFTLNAPYQSAAQIEQRQIGQLTGSAISSARWVIDGDDGIARIELAPTLVSGALRLAFHFEDETIVRTQTLESWIEPGDIEWTIVGLAEGSVGARSVADNMERGGRFDSDLGDDARVALYAKGRVLGKFLLTLAYDSAKQRDDQRVLGALDPDAYYTVFADASSRQFDAPSREKLYVRIETSTFFALYGDYDTGFDQTRLARYNRTATGLKAQARLGAVQAQGFAAEVGTRFRRDDIQGNGLSGPYRLSSRDIVANSEQVVIEVRDRFRSELIVERRALTRFVDYDIDVLSGTITFRSPVASRDFDLNPQFIVVEYEVSSPGQGAWNAGLRTDWTSASGNLRIGATAISDKGDDARTHIGALDIEAQIARNTELRAEVALSRRNGATAHGWLVEAQHQSGALDILAYARSLDQNYGVGQQSGAEIGRRKLGLDARYLVGEKLSIAASLWQDDSLADIVRRRAVQTQLAYRSQRTDLRFGVTHFADRLADGERNASTVLEAGATQRLFDNRLELGASSAIALGKANSVDLPARHKFDARYAIASDVKLLAAYEIADGAAIDARTLRAGFEAAPWNGARVVSTLGRQGIGEYGNRSVAAFGLAQTFALTSTLTLDATFDGNRTLGGGVPSTDIVNPAHPVASGGQLGQDGSLFEDFAAVTLGASWRYGRWSASARGEYRDGELADRKGATLGAIRQLGEGSVVGAGLTWTEASANNGATTQVFDGSIAVAHRPDTSVFAFLGKLEYRSDAVSGAVAGEAGPAGRTALLVDGDARSRRLIASLSTNWSPQGGEARNRIHRRTEIGLFVGARYNFDRFEGFDLEGVTTLVGLDARIGLSETVEVGANASLRANVSDGTTSYALGPQIGFTPARGVLFSVGYNITGFRDRDFGPARNTDKGFFAAVRAKFDTDTFAFLGLGR